MGPDQRWKEICTPAKIVHETEENQVSVRDGRNLRKRRIPEKQDDEGNQEISEMGECLISYS